MTKEKIKRWARLTRELAIDIHGHPAGPRKVCLDCVESYFGKGVIPAPITSVIVEPPDSQCAQFRWYARCGDQTQEGAERTHADAEERANRWILKTRLEVNHV